MSINKIPDFLKMAEQLKDDLVTYASVEGVKHFQNSFDNQGFTDTSFSPWTPLKQRLNPVRAILVNSGYLRDSIQVFDANHKQITFGSDAEYAQIHNEGGTISMKVTPKSRRYFWYMFKATGEAKWKWMALTKKSKFKVHIPQRKFLGESKALKVNIDQWVVNEILTRFSNIKHK